MSNNGQYNSSLKGFYDEQRESYHRNDYSSSTSVRAGAILNKPTGFGNNSNHAGDSTMGKSYINRQHNAAPNPWSGTAIGIGGTYSSAWAGSGSSSSSPWPSKPLSSCVFGSGGGSSGISASSVGQTGGFSKNCGSQQQQQGGGLMKTSLSFTNNNQQQIALSLRRAFSKKPPPPPSSTPPGEQPQQKTGKYSYLTDDCFAIDTTGFDSGRRIGRGNKGDSKSGGIGVRGGRIGGGESGDRGDNNSGGGRSGVGIGGKFGDRGGNKRGGGRSIGGGTGGRGGNRIGTGGNRSNSPAAGGYSFNRSSDQAVAGLQKIASGSPGGYPRDGLSKAPGGGAGLSKAPGSGASLSKAPGGGYPRTPQGSTTAAVGGFDIDSWRRIGFLSGMNDNSEPKNSNLVPIRSPFTVNTSVKISAPSRQQRPKMSILVPIQSLSTGNTSVKISPSSHQQQSKSRGGDAESESSGASQSRGWFMNSRVMTADDSPEEATSDIEEIEPETTNEQREPTAAVRGWFQKASPGKDEIVASSEAPIERETSRGWFTNASADGESVSCKAETVASDEENDFDNNTKRGWFKNANSAAKSSEGGPSVTELEDPAPDVEVVKVVDAPAAVTDTAVVTDAAAPAAGATTLAGRAVTKAVWEVKASPVRVLGRKTSPDADHNSMRGWFVKREGGVRSCGVSKRADPGTAAAGWAAMKVGRPNITLPIGRGATRSSLPIGGDSTINSLPNGDDSTKNFLAMGEDSTNSSLPISGNSTNLALPIGGSTPPITSESKDKLTPNTLLNSVVGSSAFEICTPVTGRSPARGAASDGEMSTDAAEQPAVVKIEQQLPTIWEMDNTHFGNVTPKTEVSGGLFSFLLTNKPTPPVVTEPSLRNVLFGSPTPDRDVDQTQQQVDQMSLTDDDNMSGDESRGRSLSTRASPLKGGAGRTPSKGRTLSGSGGRRETDVEGEIGADESEDAVKEHLVHDIVRTITSRAMNVSNDEEMDTDGGGCADRVVIEVADDSEPAAPTRGWFTRALPAEPRVTRVARRRSAGTGARSEQERCSGENSANSGRPSGESTSKDYRSSGSQDDDQSSEIVEIEKPGDADGCEEVASGEQEGSSVCRGWYGQAHIKPRKAVQPPPPGDVVDLE